MNSTTPLPEYPIRPNPSYDRSTFPTDVLPWWIREMADAVAANAQVDISMPGMMALGVASYAVARNVEVCYPSGQRDPLALWMMIPAEQGEGKSTSLSPLVEPIRRVERLMALAFNGGGESGSGGEPDEDDPEFGQAPSRSGWRAFSAEDAARLLLGEHDSSHPNGKVAPRLVFESVTPQALVENLAANDFGGLLVSPEGQILSHVGGGTQAVEGLAQYSKTWDGHSIDVSRVSRVAASPVRPVLSMIVCPQPGVLEAMLQGRLGKLARCQGFLSRFLFGRPASSRGRRLPVSPPIPQIVRSRYEEHLRAMLIVANSDQRNVKTVGSMDSARWREFFLTVEKRRAPDGDLGDDPTVAAWASRVRQSVGRIAGILHVADHAATLGHEVWGRPLDPATIDRAITLGEWLLEAGKDILRPGGSSVGTDQILGYVRRRFGTKTFTARDVARGHQGRMTTEEVKSHLEACVAGGKLAWTEGHASSRHFRVLPWGV